MEHIESYRLGVFLGLLCILVLLETFFERKERVMPRQGRWACLLYTSDAADD